MYTGSCVFMESVASGAHTADPALALRFCSDDHCWVSWGWGWGCFWSWYPSPSHLSELHIFPAQHYMHSFPCWEKVPSRWLTQVDESESYMFHESTFPVPESAKASYTQGDELACPFLLRLRDAQGSFVGISLAQWQWACALSVMIF